MRNLKVLQVVAFCLPMVILLSSCGIIKNNDFQTQKYTNFKKGETSANRKIITKEKKDAQLFVVSENKEAIEPIAAIAEDPSQTIVATVPEIKNEKDKPVNVKRNNFFTKETNIIKRNHNASFALNRFVNKPNTASVERGDIDLLVLVILAIFIPPLCVFLIRGLRTEFWLDLILTILFWVPGLIYALLVVFDVI